MADYSYMVIDRPLRASVGDGRTVTREVGALVPEAAGWNHRARSVLLEAGRIARVVIMTKAEARKATAAV